MLGFIMCCAIPLQGCAYQYVENGVRHVIGIAHITQKETVNSGKEIIVQQVSVLGASFLRLPEHSGVSIGYTRNFSIEILSENVVGNTSLNHKNHSNNKFAYQYVDEHGAQHIVGIAHVTQKGAVESNKEVLVQQVSVFGASVLRLPENSGISVGYTRNFSVEISDNVSGELSLNYDDPSNVKFKNVESIIKEINK